MRLIVGRGWRVFQSHLRVVKWAESPSVHSQSRINTWASRHNPGIQRMALLRNIF
jgi:hypothetical protein